MYGARCKFSQDFEPFGIEFDAEACIASDVAAGPIEARHQTAFDRIRYGRKNNRGCAGRVLGRRLRVGEVTRPQALAGDHSGHPLHA
jgi:hypothetical protein